MDIVAPSPLENKIGIPAKWLERFLSKIDRNGPNGCWLWTGYRTDLGYGHYVPGKSLGTWPVHRLMYSLCYGPIPKSMQIHHECHNPSCCFIGHLEMLTPKEHCHKTPNGLGAIAAAKTHCPKGHPYNKQNTLYRSNGKRNCRECNRIACKERFDRFRAANPIPEQTHCLQGHPLFGDNLYIAKSGARACRECHRRWTREWRLANLQDVSVKNAKMRVLRKMKRGITSFTEMEQSAISQLFPPLPA